MYPKKEFKPYGYDAEDGRYPINRVSTLGILLNPTRRRSACGKIILVIYIHYLVIKCIAEHWSPYEVAIFEASIYLYGKEFNVIQKYVG